MAPTTVGGYDYDSLSAATTLPSSAPAAVLVVTTTSAGVSWSSTSPIRRNKAAKAGDEAAATVTALTRQQDAALSAVMRDPNKLRHIFGKPQHNLGPITKELGGQETVIREAVLAVPRGTTGTFEVTRRIGQYDLTVRGRRGQWRSADRESVCPVRYDARQDVNTAYELIATFPAPNVTLTSGSR